MLRPRLVLQASVAAVVAGTLLYVDPLNFVCFLLVPNVIVACSVWLISYDHHFELPGTTHYDGSHNRFGVGFNRLRFNIGHHAAHHEKPTLHWSLLPQRSAQILSKLDPKSVHPQLARSAFVAPMAALDAGVASSRDFTCPPESA